MSARPSSRPPPTVATPRDFEAVTVAMVVAPGVYARNRVFDFFKDPAAQRARRRAATLRGVVAQLGRASSVALSANEGEGWTLRYVLTAVSFTRVLELSSAELAALRTAAERAGVGALPREAGDEEIVAGSLAKLMIPS